MLGRKQASFHPDLNGYERLETEAKVLAICRESLPVEEASEGDPVEIIIDRTPPFYARSGGQAADTGVITGGDGVEVSVTDVYYNMHDQIVHRGKVNTGTLKKGACVRGLVDVARRQATRRSHTATHLLHRALKEFLGEHVNQAGSQVVPDRIRFDLHISVRFPIWRCRILNARLTVSSGRDCR